MLRHAPVKTIKIPGTSRPVPLPRTPSSLASIADLPLKRTPFDWIIRMTRPEVQHFLQGIAQLIAAVPPACSTRKELAERLTWVFQDMVYADQDTDGLRPDRTWDLQSGVCIDTANALGAAFFAARLPAGLKLYSASTIEATAGHAALLLRHLPGLQGLPWVENGVPYYYIETTAHFPVGAIRPLMDRQGSFLPIRARPRLIMDELDDDVWEICNRGSRSTLASAVVVSRRADAEPLHRILIPPIPVDGRHIVSVPRRIATEECVVRPMRASWLL